MNENNIAGHTSPGVTHRDRQKILLIWIVILLTIGIGAITWKLNQVQKQLVALEKDLNIFKSNTARDLAYLESDLSILRSTTASDISALNSDLYMLSGDISAVNSDLYSLASNLSRVASLAENANLYAHSHPYSDAQLKSDLMPIADPLDKLLTINGGYFSWNEKAKDLYKFGNGKELGVLAQDVEAVLPELVYTDASGYKQVDYERLTVVLIEAIREQQYQIQLLENSIIEIKK